MAVCGVSRCPVIPAEPLVHGKLFPAGSNCSILTTTNLPEIPRQGR